MGTGSVDHAGVVTVAASVPIPLPSQSGSDDAAPRTAVPKSSRGFGALGHGIAHGALLVTTIVLATGGAALLPLLLGAGVLSAGLLGHSALKRRRVGASAKAASSGRPGGARRSLLPGSRPGGGGRGLLPGGSRGPGRASLSGGGGAPGGGARKPGLLGKLRPGGGRGAGPGGGSSPGAAGSGRPGGGLLARLRGALPRGKGAASAGGPGGKATPRGASGGGAKPGAGSPLSRVKGALSKLRRPGGGLSGGSGGGTGGAPGAGPGSGSSPGRRKSPVSRLPRSLKAKLLGGFADKDPGKQHSKDGDKRGRLAALRAKLRHKVADRDVGAGDALLDEHGRPRTDAQGNPLHAVRDADGNVLRDADGNPLTDIQPPAPQARDTATTTDGETTSNAGGAPAGKEIDMSLRGTQKTTGTAEAPPARRSGGGALVSGGGGRVTSAAEDLATVAAGADTSTWKAKERHIADLTNAFGVIGRMLRQQGVRLREGWNDQDTEEALIAAGRQIEGTSTTVQQAHHNYRRRNEQKTDYAEGASNEGTESRKGFDRGANEA